MHRVALFVFWMTLIMFMAVLIFASYVGVYLTYAAIPIILISGVIMRLTKPRANKIQGPFGRFVAELKSFIAKEASDLKEIIKNEADCLEKIRLEGERKSTTLQGGNDKKQKYE